MNDHDLEELRQALRKMIDDLPPEANEIAESLRAMVKLGDTIEKSFQEMSPSPDEHRKIIDELQKNRDKK